MFLISSGLTQLNSSLTANGKEFYFDYQGGKFGYNESSARGAGTFHPFDSSIVKAFLMIYRSSIYGYINTDGTYSFAPQNINILDVGNYSDIISHSGSAFVAKQAGYYTVLSGVNYNVAYYSINDPFLNYGGPTLLFLYFGETNPFE